MVGGGELAFLMEGGGEDRGDSESTFAEGLDDMLSYRVEPCLEKMAMRCNAKVQGAADAIRKGKR